MKCNSGYHSYAVLLDKPSPPHPHTEQESNSLSGTGNSIHLQLLNFHFSFSWSCSLKDLYSDEFLTMPVGIFPTYVM